jgi:hypothetical protein
VIGRRIGEIELLQLVRVSEKNEECSELEYTPSGRHSSTGIPEILDTEASITKI